MFAQVDVIVEGALDRAETVTSDQAVDAIVEESRRAAESDGLWTEVYVLWHDHAPELDCECAQYVTDHHPDYEWNRPE